MTRTEPRVPSSDMETYRELVDELMQKTCDEKKIKKLMERLGLKYVTERVDRLSSVLAYTPSPQSKGASRDL